MNKRAFDYTVQDMRAELSQAHRNISDLQRKLAIVSSQELEMRCAKLKFEQRIVELEVENTALRRTVADLRDFIKGMARNALKVIKEV